MRVTLPPLLFYAAIFCLKAPAASGAAAPTAPAAEFLTAPDDDAPRAMVAPPPPPTYVKSCPGGGLGTPKCRLSSQAYCNQVSRVRAIIQAVASATLGPRNRE